MADLVEEELELALKAIEEGKVFFSDDGEYNKFLFRAEQNVISDWVSKLSQTPSSEKARQVRNQRILSLVKQVTEEKQLRPPFIVEPPLEPEEQVQMAPPPSPGPSSVKEINKTYEVNGNSKAFSASGTNKSYQVNKLPCSRPKKAQGAIPKPRRTEKVPPSQSTSTYNEFEDAQEMAKIIARSKGQTLPEFIGAIARHTSDYGVELVNVMRSEMSNFTEYVDHVLSQRIKDLTEVLDEEQNRELQRIKKSIERWQLELAHVKRLVLEIIPDFDEDLYKTDKYYLKKLFSVESPTVQRDDSFEKWKEETCHRLKWMNDMNCKMSQCNEHTLKEIADIKGYIAEMEEQEAQNQQNYSKYVGSEKEEFDKLKAERDRLKKENDELLNKLKGRG